MSPYVRHTRLFPERFEQVRLEIWLLFIAVSSPQQSTAVFIKINCAVKGCKDYYRKTKNLGKKVQYFSFPKENDMALKWLEVCKTQDTKGKVP